MYIIYRLTCHINREGNVYCISDNVRWNDVWYLERYLNERWIRTLDLKNKMITVHRQNKHDTLNILNRGCDWVTKGGLGFNDAK
jgi:hypothetical protein